MAMTSIAVSMSASSLGVGKRIGSPRRSVVVAAARSDVVEQVKVESIGKRREVILAAAAAALWWVGGVALAEGDEPKRGTPEAKKKYAPVCVTMPTARICRN